MPRSASARRAMQRIGVSRREILVRGLLHRCPNCGGNGVFRGLYGLNHRCSICGFLVQREDGFFVGAMALNFAAATVPMVAIFVLVFMQRISVPLAMAITAAWGIAVPLLFYQTSRSLWLMLVYLVIPHQLPANQGELGTYQEPF